MFRERDPQVSLVASRCSWFRRRRPGAGVGPGFPERGAPCADNGRPNRAVQMFVLLKEMFNLTDDEALEQLEFNLLCHHALRLDMEETHLPQKTLPQLPSSPDAARRWPAGFQETTERIIQALGIRTSSGWTPPNHEQHRHDSPASACSVRRCGCSFGP